MKPFLKWAGGKRWLADEIIARIPKTFNRYVEPFVGSGAVFFKLAPERAILSDVNASLINVYKTIKNDPASVYDGLVALQKRHSKKIYYQMRSNSPDCPLDAAVRFIYLNRTCWNGLYRVNRKNEFNVPIGTKTSVIFVGESFHDIANSLASAELHAADFEETIDATTTGDLIYVDPPYTVKHNKNGFIKYNQLLFSWEDQIRLRNCLLRARQRGCHIIMSNADHVSISELYADFPDSWSITRESIIAGLSTGRGQTTELLVVHHG